MASAPRMERAMPTRLMAMPTARAPVAREEASVHTRAQKQCCWRQKAKNSGRKWEGRDRGRSTHVPGAE
eukprot:4616721-Pleurochrysis_carterae.AAC.5